MRIFFVIAAASALMLPVSARHKTPKMDEWRPIFDGSTLEGWKAADNPGSWSVKDGVLHGEGSASYLFYMGEVCRNCEFKAEVKLNHAGTSGMYFRAAFAPGSPKAYQAQSASLSDFVKVVDQPIPDDAWWTQHVVVDGNHIQIFVNDKKTVDFIDEQNTFTSGYLALGHDSGVVEYKNLMIRALPGPRTPLAGTWRLNRAQSKETPGELPTQLELRILEERDGLRYQSASVTADGQKHGVNYFARPDGYDYLATGSTAYNHASIEETNLHKVHDAMRIAKLRKKLDEHVYLTQTKMGREVIGKATYIISTDRKTLIRDGSLKGASGQNVEYHEVFEKVE
jgi:3-keto-disaccharide hydrolase